MRAAGPGCGLAGRANPACNLAGPKVVVGCFIGRSLLSTVKIFHFYFYFFQKHLNNRFAQLLNSI
jgi:hypothetical protein